MNPRIVIALFVVVLAIVVALRVIAARRGRRQAPPASALATAGRNPEFEALLRRTAAGPGPAGATAPAIRPARAGTADAAAGLLATVRRLQAASAPWPQILAAVNPRADAALGELLARLRGPHQFAPQVALNVLEDACERVLAADPAADVTAALREALRRTDIVSRERD